MYDTRGERGGVIGVRSGRSRTARRSARGSRRAETLDLTIDSLAARGDGVGRSLDGRVVFVPFTAPGDRVRVRVTEARARFVRAKVETLLVPSPLRTQPVCAVFGTCGGCSWQHVEYEAQVEAKAEILTDALTRLGGLELPAPVTMIPSPLPYAYRIRSRVREQGSDVGYRRARSHRVCAITRCPILDPALDAKLGELAAAARDRSGDPRDNPADPRDNPADSRDNPADSRDHPADSRDHLDRSRGPGREWELSLGSPAHGSEGATATQLGTASVGTSAATTRSTWLSVGGERIGVSAGVFIQANGSLLETLARAVLTAAGSGRLALEIFSGAGFLTLGLARSFRRLVAIESNPRAVSDLRANLADAGATDVEVRCASLESQLAARALGSLRPDVLVLDPPRSGLPPGSGEALADLEPRRIVYLSCDPATLARDLAIWVRRGFRLREVEGFDLFPQTPHLEALAVLER